MRFFWYLLPTALLAWSSGADAAGCDFDARNMKKSGVYFLVPKPETIDILQVDAKEVFDSMETRRPSSFTCKFSTIAGARDDFGLFHARFQEWVCVNTKTQASWNPREFQYMSRSGEPRKVRGMMDLSADDTDFVLLDNDGKKHWFSLGGWQPGVLDTSVQRSESIRQGGEHSDTSRGAYRHRIQGDCSKSDQFVLYSVSELFHPQELQNYGKPEPRVPMILVAKESEGPYTLAAPRKSEAPEF